MTKMLCFLYVPVKVSVSEARLLATPWTAAHQAPPSMGFSRQEFWSGVPSPSPGNSFLFQMFLMIGDSRYRNFLLFLKVRDSRCRISGGLLIFIPHLWIIFHCLLATLFGFIHQLLFQRLFSGFPAVS